MDTKDNLNQSPKILLATSLAPRDIANQQQAVQSWIDSGFDVISINNPDEIQLLQPHFSQIQFAAAPRNGRRRYGKPLIYIDDILDALRASGRPMVGVINSDIHLRIDDTLRKKIAYEAKNSLLYIRRTNVDYLGDPNGKLSIKGIDLFLMSQSVLRQMPPSQFCLGVSWWDVYFPAFCATSGIPLKKLDAPVAFHIKHAMNWDRRQWTQNAEHFFECIYNLSRQAPPPSLLSQLQNQWLTLWKFYYGVKQGTLTVKDSERMMGSKYVHHIINKGTQCLDYSAVPITPAQEHTLASALQHFQDAQNAFDSGQMVSARRLMAQYQARVDYNQIPRIDRRKAQTAPAMSVIIVTCDRSKDVDKLLDCLTVQTYRDFETLVVDNGNTDLSLVRDKADCIIQSPINFKPAEGRNIGVHFARGRIVVFIDDDALIPENYLSAIEQAFQTYRILGLRGKTLPKTQSDSAALLCDLGDVPYSTSCNQEGNAAFLAWAWGTVGGQDPLLFGHEGIDLSWRLMQAFGLNNAIIYWPAAVIYHDYGDISKMRNKNIRYFQIGNYLRYKYDCDISLRQKEAEHQPLTPGNALDWTITIPPHINRWKSLCYSETDTAIRAMPGVKVSIIISCYNAAQYLAECLDSVCAQTLTDWEAIIVDDGSKDNSVEILKQYATRDSRFRIYTNSDNRGPYVRRNFAIGQAKAPFIVLHDADDMMAPQKLEILLGEILKDDRLGIVGAFYGWFMGQFQGLDCCDRITGKVTHEDMLTGFLDSKRDICCHAAAIIRKTMFDRIGLYDTHPWGADSFWLAKAAMYGILTGSVRYKNIPEYLSFIRKHSESQTGKINPNDPRGRRRRLVHFFRDRLQRIVEKKKQCPDLDVGRELQQCTCSDFIPLFGHLFEQWESMPVNTALIKSRMDAAVSEFLNRMVVKANMLLDTLKSMLPDAEQKVVGFNLLRGLCQFACGADDVAGQCLRKEYEDHKTVQALRFLELYLNTKHVQLDSAQRRKIVDDFIFAYPEIENPAAEAIFDNRKSSPTKVSVVMDCRDLEIDLGSLITAWSSQRGGDFELVVLTCGNRKSDFDSPSQLPLSLVVVNINDPVAKAVAKNLALPHCRGDIIAFVWPQLRVVNTFIQDLIERFSRGDVSAVRGKIVSSETLLPHPEYDLGDQLRYGCADTDKLCAVRRREIDAHGGFGAGLFGTDMLGLSYKIYNSKKGNSSPMVYLPQLTGILSGDKGKTDYLLYALSKEQLFWRLSAPQQYAIFMQFAENYHSCGDTAAAIPTVARNIMTYFMPRCMPVALEWAQKAIQLSPDSIDAVAGLAMCEFKAGDKDRAAQLFQDILNRPFAKAIDRRVFDEQERRQYAEAIRCYADSLLMLAECQMQKGCIQDAQQAAQRLLANQNVVLDSDRRSRADRILNGRQSSDSNQSRLISVIMPAYNAAPFIGAAIGSVLAQSYPHLELIIVNDGSTDDTEQIIRQFNDPRIWLETQPNAGPAAARNRGLKLAAGQFIVFLDSDDAMSPEFIADHLREFESHPETDLVYCDDQLVDADGKPMRIIERKEYAAPSEIVRELFLNGYPIVPFRTCIRKRVFDKIGLYDPALHVAEDYDMIRRFFAANLTARHLNRPHYLRRMAPDSQSRSLSPEKARMHLGVVGKFIDTFDPSCLFPQVNWQSLDPVQRQHKITAVTAEFFLSLSLNYMKMPEHEAYAEHALQVSERYLSQAPANGELERVIQTFQQTRSLFERWKKAQKDSLPDSPRVSVIMSCLNMERYLPECLDSILAQTLRSWELIVVDDGSTDGTQEILKRYAQADSRIRVYLNNDTQGPYVRRNFAIGQAMSPFISIQDADDIMAPQKLEILLREITADSSLGIVGSYFGQFLDTFIGPEFCDCKKKLLTHSQIMETFNQTWHLCWHGSAIIRKSLFDRVGLYDSQPWGSDSFWLAKAGLYGQLSGTVFFKNVPEILTYKREHPRSQTGLISPLDPRSRRAALYNYGTQKLDQIRRQAQANRAFDYARAISDCNCNDFIPKFGHLFTQWESAPLDAKTIGDLMDCAVSECAENAYVGAAMTLAALCAIAPGIDKRQGGVNLLRGVCCYAYGNDKQAAQYLQQEYADHKTAQAVQFCEKAANAPTGGKQRRAVANDYLFAQIIPMLRNAGVLSRQYSPANPQSLDAQFALAVREYRAGDRHSAVGRFEQILNLPFAKAIEQKIFGPNERKNYAEAINCYATCCIHVAEYYADKGQKVQGQRMITRLMSNKNIILDSEMKEKVDFLLGLTVEPMAEAPLMAN